MEGRRVGGAARVRGGVACVVTLIGLYLVLTGV